MTAKYLNKGCPQRDSVEREEYAGARSAGVREHGERDGADLLERILDRNNLNRAYKQVKRNHGAPGIDGMTVEEALPWLREHREELLNSIWNGKYKPSPVRRKEIPKPDGSGVRKLGIPTVVDRIIQQAIAYQLQPIFEPLFLNGSYGYRPGRSAQQAMQKVKGYAEQGYTYVAIVDLTKYFDTLNHELLMNLLRRQIHDKRVTDLIKKYLKSGVMENGVICKTEEGSPQGGPLSPLLANIYLNEFDMEMESRRVKVIRYADDIVVFAKSQRAAGHLLESSRKYLEGKLKLKVNAQKSKAVSVYSKQFKFLGFTLGKNGSGIYIRAHRKSLIKAKRKLKELTYRNQGRNVRKVMKNVKVYIRGWIGYYYIASMKRILQNWNEWLRRRFRMYIWKQWKKPKTKVQNLRKLGVPNQQAYQWGNSRLGYWRITGSPVLTRSITNEKLARAGYCEFPAQYEQLRKLHLCD